MLGYHVHEKAIMTAILPMTLLTTNSLSAARLYVRTCMFGLFGILPLLFRPEEFLFKVLLFLAWMCGAILILEEGLNSDDKRMRSSILTKVDLVSFAILGCALLFMEIIHPIVFMPSGRMEFLPLMTTSVISAIGLAWCWLEAYRQMQYVSSVKGA